MFNSLLYAHLLYNNDLRYNCHCKLKFLKIIYTLSLYYYYNYIQWYTYSIVDQPSQSRI